MCLDYFKVDAPNILAIMNGAFSNGGYDITNGFVHDFAVVYFKKLGLEAYRKEELTDTDEIVQALDRDNPVIVSIIKHTLEQQKFHIILLVGYVKGDNGVIEKFIYHEPESTDPERGAYREVDTKTFMENWRGKAIFPSPIV